MRSSTLHGLLWPSPHVRHSHAACLRVVRGRAVASWRRRVHGAAARLRLCPLSVGASPLPLGVIGASLLLALTLTPHHDGSSAARAPTRGLQLLLRTQVRKRASVRKGRWHVPSVMHLREALSPCLTRAEPSCALTPRRMHRARAHQAHVTEQGQRVRARRHLREQTVGKPRRQRRLPPLPPLCKRRRVRWHAVH